MIKLLLMGGLGNQMFQYAFARSLALRKNDGLQISQYYFRDDYFGRVYALNNLSLPDDVKLMTKYQDFITNKKFSIIKKIQKLFRKKKNDFYTDGAILLDDFDKYMPEFISPDFGGKNIIIHGYFQAWKYFRDYDFQIKNELKVSTSPSPENAKIIKELENCESVCVHVRRGDYLKLNFVNMCTYEYYERAMKYISSKINSPVFYFFSYSHEDIEWLKNNWKFADFNVKYIDLNNPDYEELRLMYSCRHFIIANSTFSWWGSYLSGSPNKIICAPSKWIDERPVEQTNIFLPEWRIIS